MRLAVLASVTVVIVACTSGGGDPTGTGTSSGASSADGGGSSSGGGSSGTTSGSSSGGMSSSGDGGSFAERGCQGAVSLTSLVKYGQTSSCSHPVPVTYDPNMINVYYSPSPGVTERLCQTSRTSCEQWKGWFFIGEEIAFCDETCAKIDSTEQSEFLVETGCPTVDCF